MPIYNSQLMEPTIFIIAITFLIMLAISVIPTWKLFSKANVPGWKSIIPIYSIFVMIKITFGENKNWLIITMLLTSFLAVLLDCNILLVINPIVSMYLNFKFMRRYAGTGMSIASLFFPIIIYPIVAFSSKYQYTSPKEIS